MAVFAATGPGDEPADRVALVLNAGSKTETYRLPEPRGLFCWHVVADSADEARVPESIRTSLMAAPPRTVLVLAEMPVQATAAD